MPREVIMPALGMAQSTGLIVAWLKQPGEKVKAGEALMEVETDKAVMEVEAQADGFLTDVRASAGDTVPVGDVVALISETPVDVLTANAPRAESEAQSPTSKKIVAGSPAKVEANGGNIEKTRGKSVATSQPAPRTESKWGESRTSKAFAGLELNQTGQRILASPKARRMAAEQGLELAALVAASIPQPYHVSDLDTLAALTSSNTATAPTLSSASRHLVARVPADNFARFCEWMRSEIGASPNAISVMAGMGAAALRQGASFDKPIVVAVEAFGSRRVYVDPDRHGLGRANDAEMEEGASLILRDLRSAAVTAVELGGEDAPVLSVMREGPEMLITLEYTPGQLTAAAAIGLISGFAGQLSEPLRHLL
jgi:pyruvate/2-oxoglutarate dehydrogenase complex dihydrolipoamide acyltransferase (E2) component